MPRINRPVSPQPPGRSARLQLRPTARPWCLLLAAVALAWCGAAGAETSPYYIGLSQGFLHDSNLYRLDEGAFLGPGKSRSDTVATTSLLAGLDQPMGRQRVYGTVAVRNNHYASNDYLNHVGYNLDTGLDWSTVERVSGTLTLHADQGQRPFNIDTGVRVDTQQNIQNTLDMNAAFRVGLVTQWSAEASLGFGRLDFSAPNFAGSEYRRNSASLGTRWRPSAIINFGAAVRYTQADYQARGDTATRWDLDFTSGWEPDGYNSAYFRISPTHITYDVGTASNFSGVTGAATWQWQPTAKLHLNTGYLRDANQDSFNQRLLVPIGGGGFAGVQVVTDDTYLTDTLRGALDYEVTSKLAATLGASYAKRSLVRANSVGELRDTDQTTITSLGLRWTPTRGVQIGCEAGSERRSAGGVLSQPYSTTLYHCEAQLVLR